MISQVIKRPGSVFVDDESHCDCRDLFGEGLSWNRQKIMMHGRRV